MWCLLQQQAAPFSKWGWRWRGKHPCESVAQPVQPAQHRWHVSMGCTVRKPREIELGTPRDFKLSLQASGSVRPPLPARPAPWSASDFKSLWRCSKRGQRRPKRNSLTPTARMKTASSPVSRRASKRWRNRSIHKNISICEWIGNREEM